MTDKQIASIKEVVSSDQLQISLLNGISDKLSKLLVLQRNDIESLFHL